MISVSGLKFLKLISSLILFCGLFANAQTISSSEKATPAPNTFVALRYHDISSGFVGNVCQSLSQHLKGEAK